jgi:hypothetical protein
MRIQLVGERFVLFEEEQRGGQVQVKVPGVKSGIFLNQHVRKDLSPGR